MTQTVLTANEMLVIAIETERKQYNFYEAVGPTRSGEIQKAFMKFAGQGREHEHKFRDILADVGGYSPSKSCVNFAYLQGIADSSVYAGHRLGELALKKTLNDAEAVEAASASEKDSILFYSEARDLVPQKDATVVDGIISQAKDHVSELSSLLNKLREAPALLKT
ncbi:MAG: ferritin family protein [Dehalococcoidales bacterium]|nr:ferritin family protein [Dehalococcoidales bacterium]